MDPIIQQLKSIELEHRWWSPEVFLRLENKTLERKVKAVLENHAWITKLAAEGTVQDIETFKNALHEKTPLMIVSVLACFLDTMFLQETLRLPISIQIVGWYRQQGWQFPKFRSELQLDSAIESLLNDALRDE
jgi:hypothetical protein